MIVGLPINPGGGLGGIRLLAAGAGTYTVGIGDGSGYRGDTVAVAVHIDNATDLAACDLTITFDPTAFQITDVALSTLTSGFSLEWNVTGGILNVSLASSTSLDAGSGDLCSIEFRVRDGAVPGDTTLNLAAVKLSGEHGEDLAWQSQVTMSSGLFTIHAVQEEEAPHGAPGLMGIGLIALGIALTGIGARKTRG